jgi:Phage tail baseplate hub (GPD)
MSRPFSRIRLLEGRKRQTQPLEVHIHQTEFKHDVAVVHLFNESHEKVRYQAGQPIHIRFGWYPHGVFDFHGYVHHTERHEHAHHPRSLNIYCIGAAYPTKEVAHRSFHNKKSHAIIKHIAKEHRFSDVYEEDNHVLDLVTQHGQTDWEFCVNLAKRRGFTFYAINTDIHYHRRCVEAEVHKAQAFVKFPNSEHRQRGAVYEFKHEVGETHPHTHKRVRVHHGVGIKGEPIKVKVLPPKCNTAGDITTPPIFTKTGNKKPHSTKGAAKEHLKGLAERWRFHLIAHAVVSGDAKVHQGSTIRLQGLDSEDDGYWYVIHVKHHITRKDYRMELRLGRDAMGDISKFKGPKKTTNKPVSPITKKPVVIDGCGDPTDGGQQTPPETVYDPVDDCVPVIDLGDPSMQVAQGPHRVANVPKSVRNQKCRCCGGTKHKKRKQPRTHGWKSKHVKHRKAKPRCR